MMKTLTEADLRAAKLLQDQREYVVDASTYVTPLAKEFLKDRGIELVHQKSKASPAPIHGSWQVMAQAHALDF